MCSKIGKKSYFFSPPNVCVLRSQIPPASLPAVCVYTCACVYKRWCTISSGDKSVSSLQGSATYASPTVPVE